MVRHGIAVRLSCGASDPDKPLRPAGAAHRAGVCPAGQPARAAGPGGGDEPFVCRAGRNRGGLRLCPGPDRGSGGPGGCRSDDPLRRGAAGAAFLPRLCQRHGRHGRRGRRPHRTDGGRRRAWAVSGRPSAGRGLVALRRPDAGRCDLPGGLGRKPGARHAHHGLLRPGRLDPDRRAGLRRAGPSGPASRRHADPGAGGAAPVGHLVHPGRNGDPVPLHHLAEAWALSVLPPWLLDLSVAF